MGSADWVAGCIATTVCAVALSVLWTGPGLRVVPAVVTVDVILFFLVGIAVTGLVESLRVARAHAEYRGEPRATSSSRSSCTISAIPCRR